MDEHRFEVDRRPRLFKPVLMVILGCCGVNLNDPESFRYHFSLLLTGHGMTWYWFEWQYFDFLSIARYLRRQSKTKPPTE